VKYYFGCPYDVINNPRYILSLEKEHVNVYRREEGDDFDVRDENKWS